MKRKNSPIAIPLSERPTVNIDEFCALVGISRSSFYKAVDAGEIKLSKLGKRTLITQDELKRFVTNLQPKPKTAQKINPVVRSKPKPVPDVAA